MSVTEWLVVLIAGAGGYWLVELPAERSRRWSRRAPSRLRSRPR